MQREAVVVRQVGIRDLEQKGMAVVGAEIRLMHSSVTGAEPKHWGTLMARDDWYGQYAEAQLAIVRELAAFVKDGSSDFASPSETIRVIASASDNPNDQRSRFDAIANQLTMTLGTCSMLVTATQVLDPNDTPDRPTLTAAQETLSAARDAARLLRDLRMPTASETEPDLARDKEVIASLHSASRKARALFDVYMQQPARMPSSISVRRDKGRLTLLILKQSSGPETSTISREMQLLTFSPEDLRGAVFEAPEGDHELSINTKHPVMSSEVGIRQGQSSYSSVRRVELS